MEDADEADEAKPSDEWDYFGSRHVYDLPAVRQEERTLRAVYTRVEKREESIATAVRDIEELRNVTRRDANWVFAVEEAFRRLECAYLSLCEDGKLSREAEAAVARHMEVLWLDCKVNGELDESKGLLPEEIGAPFMLMATASVMATAATAV